MDLLRNVKTILLCLSFQKIVQRSMEYCFFFPTVLNTYINPQN